MNVCEKPTLRSQSKLNPNNSWLDFMIYGITDNFGSKHAEKFIEIIPESIQYWHL